MIGLAFSVIKMMIWAMLASMDLMFIVCTLGKVDPKMHRFF